MKSAHKRATSCCSLKHTITIFGMAMGARLRQHGCEVVDQGDRMRGAWRNNPVTMGVGLQEMVMRAHKRATPKRDLRSPTLALGGHGCGVVTTKETDVRAKFWRNTFSMADLKKTDKTSSNANANRMPQDKLFIHKV